MLSQTDTAALPGHSSRGPSALSLVFSSGPPSPALTGLPQVHDDARLLARGTLSKTYLQAAGGRPGPHSGLDLQPGEAALPRPSGPAGRVLSEFLLPLPGGECGSSVLLSPPTGVPGPINAPGPVLPQLPRHPQLYLLLWGGFRLLSRALARGALSAPTPGPAGQWRTQTALTSTPHPSPDSILSYGPSPAPAGLTASFLPFLLAGASCRPRAPLPSSSQPAADTDEQGGGDLLMATWFRPKCWTGTPPSRLALPGGSGSGGTGSTRGRADRAFLCWFCLLRAACVPVAGARSSGYSRSEGGWSALGPPWKATSAPDGWCQWLINSDTNLLC